MWNYFHPAYMVHWVNIKSINLNDYPASSLFNLLFDLKSFNYSNIQFEKRLANFASQKTVLQQDHSDFLFVCFLSLGIRQIKLHEKKRWYSDYFLRTTWFYLTEYHLIRKIEEAIQSNSIPDDFKTWLLCLYIPICFQNPTILHARYLFALLINIHCSNLFCNVQCFYMWPKPFLSWITQHTYICQQYRARSFFLSTDSFAFINEIGFNDQARIERIYNRSDTMKPKNLRIQI